MIKYLTKSNPREEGLVYFGSEFTVQGNEVQLGEEGVVGVARSSVLIRK